MGTGIAMKSGNADGVKVTHSKCKRKDKHPLHAVVEEGWQET
jgi:hypothetical protein